MGAKGSKSLSKEALKTYQEKFGVTKAEIKKLHKVWLGYASGSDDGSMDLAGFTEFCKDVNSDDGNIPTIFEFIDTSGDGLIQFDEWIVFVLRAKNPSFEDYAQLVIDLYDEDGDGSVSVDEVRKLALSKAKVEGRVSDERKQEIEDTIQAIFKFADKDGDGKLTREELIAASKSDPSFAQSL
eukprot:TRINITY_DN886_c0_g1_i2.p1 TRINITY_DN886_c0_g1~~TRINITY_DN886_c0_g1_i2.p1  ORF type:complete len:196 (-),score=105.01 TRINITY_DN886_c0_g1_i2:64-612(-)